MDGDEDWVWGAEGPGFVDVQELRAQLAFSGSLQALKEIRSVCYCSVIVASCFTKDIQKHSIAHYDQQPSYAQT